MKLERHYTLQEIAAIIGCAFVGDPNHPVTGINEIHRVEHGDIVFVDHPKYYEKALKSAATTILIDKEVECPEGKGLLVSTAPFDDFNRLTRHFRPTRPFHQSIGANTEIADSVTIYPNVSIGNNVRIGENVVLYPGVVLMDHTTIEDNVVIGPNTVIGHYAFYYKKKPDGYHRMHTCGGVLIRKNAEIGASCTIDAGVSALTIIGEGSKLDNHIHIGHDTIIGKNCLLAANVGLAGCVELKDNVTLWGQVGCASDVVIGENVVVFAQSGISKSLAPDRTYFGSPAKDIRLAYRELAALRKLPEIIENL